MYLSIQLSLFEFVVLFISAAILGGAIKFFVASNRALKKTLERDRTSILPIISFKKETQPIAQPSLDDDFEPEFLTAKKDNGFIKEKEVNVLKEHIQQQQNSLDALLDKLDELQLAPINKSLQKENEELKEKLGQLEEELEQKENDLQHIKQKEAVAQKMATRLEDVYKEFEFLQSKIATLEHQSKNASTIELTLTELKESYEGAKREMLRKQEKLDEVLSENQKLYNQLSEVEDKLAEANMQRQQLLKKVQYLTEMNNDMQGITDTNKKLQNELRRISELESMLNMMIEEREQTQRKNGKGS